MTTPTTTPGRKLGPGNSPALDAAIGAAGSLTALAAALGIHKTAVSQWRRGRIPAERVPEIEALTGISRHQLRPDLWPAEVVG